MAKMIMMTTITSATATATATNNSLCRVMLLLPLWLLLLLFSTVTTTCAAEETVVVKNPTGRSSSSSSSSGCSSQQHQQHHSVNIPAVYDLAHRWLPAHLVAQISFEALEEAEMSRSSSSKEAKKEEEPQVLCYDADDHHHHTEENQGSFNCSCSPCHNHNRTTITTQVQDMFEYEAAAAAPPEASSSFNNSNNQNNNETDGVVAVVVIIRGTTTAALTAGFGWYLKYECQAHLSWTGDQWPFVLGNNSHNPTGLLPAPPPSKQVRRYTRQGKYSYYQNVCTVSYSMVWWNLQRYYRELDWMALSGINMPLAFQGQEMVWQQTFMELGLADTDVRTWLGGPAFQAWQRMGNLQAWGGPMPQAWIDGQYQLQTQLLKRMCDLGMKPTLPAFAGFVPPEMVQYYPDAHITLSNAWGNFNATYTPVHLVEATDPLFQTIGTLFLQKQRQLYAPYFEHQVSQQHNNNNIQYYNADTYNEMDPTLTDLTYLRQAAKSVFRSIRSVDPTGVWVMQGWLFENSKFWTKDRIRAYLSGVDDDDDDDDTDDEYNMDDKTEERLIILDLYSEVFPQYERSDYYFGKSYIYNMLHNFGGNHGLYGRMQQISKDPIELFQHKHKKQQQPLASTDDTNHQNQNNNNNNNIQGVGLTMEGINQNYIVYELMTEMSWRTNTSGSSDFLSRWTQDYVTRRYALSSNHVSMQAIKAAGDAWQQLLRTVYMCPTTQMGVTKSIAVRRPRMANMTHAGFQPSALFYPPEELHKAWTLLLEAGLEDVTLASLETYRYDLVDVTRQVLSDFLLKYHARMLASFQAQEEVLFQASSHTFLGILDDLEKILATHDLFLLETQWLGPARDLAKAHHRALLSQGKDSDSNSNSESESDIDDLVALYEFNARNQITLWGPQGEISDYASKQFASLMKHYYRPRWALFVQFASDALASRSKFDDKRFNNACLALEQLWQTGREQYQQRPIGNTVETSRDLYEKYIGEEEMRIQ